jgi:hypothetical protein
MGERPRPVLSWLAGSIGSPPPASLPGLIDLMLLFLVISSVAGAYRAMVCKETQQRSGVQRFLTGFVQIVLLYSVAAAVALAMGHWMELEAAVWILLGIECLEILRTAVKLQMCGGYDLGPAKPLIERLGNLLLVDKLGQKQSANGSGESRLKT